MLLNNAVLAGVWFDGVPVVDQYMLGVFFRGELIEFATSQGRGSLKTEQKRILYTDASDGPEAFRKCLALIPQFEPLLRGIEKRWVPIAPVKEGDWAGMYLSVTCVPKVNLPASMSTTPVVEDAVSAVSISGE
jgi:hypothetical protein